LRTGTVVSNFFTAVVSNISGFIRSRDRSKGSSLVGSGSSFIVFSNDTACRRTKRRRPVRTDAFGVMWAATSGATDWPLFKLQRGR